MAGIMLDSTSESAVAAAVRAGMQWRGSVIRAAAGYVDGAYRWPTWPAGVAQVQITALGTTGAHVHVGEAADIEPGDLDPAQGASWALAERKAGAWPVLYVNRSNKPSVISACSSTGLMLPVDYGLWVATLDGTFADTNGADLRGEAGVVAVQYGNAQIMGINADGSVLTKAGDSWLGLTASWQAQALAMAEQLAALIKANQ